MRTYKSLFSSVITISAYIFILYGLYSMPGLHIHLSSLYQVVLQCHAKIGA